MPEDRTDHLTDGWSERIDSIAQVLFTYNASRIFQDREIYWDPTIIGNFGSHDGVGHAIELGTPLYCTDVIHLVPVPRGCMLEVEYLTHSLLIVI